MPEPAMRIAGESRRALPRKVAFTNRTLAAVTIPPGADRAWVYDSGCANLGYMVTPSARSFYWCGRVRGRRSPIRYRLGGDEIGIEQARRLAKQTSIEVANGIDPMQQRKRLRAGTTLRELFTKFLEEYAKLHKRSWRKDQERFDKHLSVLADRNVETITREDVDALIRRIGQTKPGAANRVLSLVSAIYRRVAPSLTNPARGVTKFEEHRRERVMSPDELSRFFEALNQTPQPWRDLFEVALLTGQRIGNVQAMRWDELVLADGLWRIPASKFKTNQPHEVVLAPRVVWILKSRANNASEYVFPSDSATGCLVEPKGPWADLCTRAKLAGLWIHDLRATCATMMAMQNVTAPVIQRALGHRSPNTTAKYVRLATDQIRRAAVDTAAFMLTKNRPARGRRK
jgi:integrase